MKQDYSEKIRFIMNDILNLDAFYATGNSYGFVLCHGRLVWKVG